MLHYKVHIVFERIQNKMVVGYEILKNTVHVDPKTNTQQITQKRIAFIPDNGKPRPILVNKKLIYDDSYMHARMGNYVFRIPNQNLIINDNRPFRLFADGIEVPDDAYIMNKESQSISYFSISSNLPELSAEYYIDGIEYQIDTTDTMSYTILPAIDETLAVIGRHTELI